MGHILMVIPYIQREKQNRLPDSCSTGPGSERSDEQQQEETSLDEKTSHNNHGKQQQQQRHQ